MEAMTILVKPKKKHVSPRLMNAMLVGIARRNSEFQRPRECDASVDRVSEDDEIGDRMSINRSLQEDLFGGADVYKALQSRDVMEPQGNAQECQMAEDSLPELEPHSTQ